MPLAAAVVGSAVVGAGATLAASSKASKAQTQAANQAQQTEMANLALQERLYNQQRADQQPWREAGTGALAQLVAGTGAGGEFNRNFTMADFQADPGYQFRMEQGLRSLDASLNRRGLSESGAAMREAVRFGQGQASDEYGRAYDRFNNDRTQGFNRLASIAGVGQTANAAMQNATQQFGNQAASSYGAQAGNLRDLGNARASSYANTGAAIGGLANNVGQYFSLRNLMQPQTSPNAWMAGTQLNLNSIGSLGTSPVFQPVNFGG